jgi:hypothetical protein
LPDEESKRMQAIGKTGARMFGRLLFVIALLAGPATAADFEAAPMATSGPNPTYPRLVKFPDEAVMTRVNARLDTLEKRDRAARRDCLAQIRQAKEKPSADSFSQRVLVGYLSARYLSINVLQNYDCAGPYPTNGAATPVTFDLRSGAAVDWTSLFKPGFLPREGKSTSKLADLYRAKYRADTPNDDDECRDVIKDDDTLFRSQPTFRLDAQTGLVMQPEFPHVIAACADDVALSADELALYLKDATLASDLRDTAGKKP